MIKQTISTDPVANLAREATFKALDDSGHNIMLHFIVYFKDTDGAQIKDMRFPPYAKTLLIDNTTPVDATGNYCITNGEYDFNHPDFYKGEYDFITEAIDAGANFSTLVKNGILRADYYKKFDI